jgi:hypothetical protein
MQFGPATRRRLFAVKSSSQTPRAFDSGASPSPSIEAYTVAEPTPVSSAAASISGTPGAGTMTRAWSTGSGRSRSEAKQRWPNTAFCRGLTSAIRPG